MNPKISITRSRKLKGFKENATSSKTTAEFNLFQNILSLYHYDMNYIH